MMLMTILDYSTNRVIFTELESYEEGDEHAIYEALGTSESSCHFMVSEKEDVSISILDEDLEESSVKEILFE